MGVEALPWRAKSPLTRLLRSTTVLRVVHSLQITRHDGVLDGCAESGCRSNTKVALDLQAVERHRVALRQLNAAVDRQTAADVKDAAAWALPSTLTFAAPWDWMLPSTVTLNALSCAPERT